MCLNRTWGHWPDEGKDAAHRFLVAHLAVLPLRSPELSCGSRPSQDSGAMTRRRHRFHSHQGTELGLDNAPCAQ